MKNATRKFNRMISAAALCSLLALTGCSAKETESASDALYTQLITNINEGNYTEAAKTYNFNKEDLKGFKDADALYYYAQAKFTYETLIEVPGFNNQMDAFKNDLNLIPEDYSGEMAEEIKEFKAFLAEDQQRVIAENEANSEAEE